jgi:hypothetical protein
MTGRADCQNVRPMQIGKALSRRNMTEVGQQLRSLIFAERIGQVIIADGRRYFSHSHIKQRNGRPTGTRGLIFGIHYVSGDSPCNHFS